MAMSRCDSAFSLLFLVMHALLVLMCVNEILYCIYIDNNYSYDTLIYV